MDTASPTTTAQDLLLTYKELALITTEDLDRFEVIYNDIPKDGHSSLYIEDDGRQFRYFKFKDIETNLEYSFSYVWEPEWRTEFPSAFLGDPPAGISFVANSVLYPDYTSKAIDPPKVLSPAEQADTDLMARYRAIEHTTLDFKDYSKIVPKATVKDILQFLKTAKFSMLDLRAKIIPVCIEYNINDKSFWAYLQRKAGNWK